MRVPVSWLARYCRPGLSVAELAERLSMTGTEVERTDHVGVPRESIGQIVAAKVLSVDEHPNADRLSVCTVDDGSAATRRIVCGAPNVAAGQTVVVARPGTTLASGIELGEAKLRGIVSEGMICAEDELGIGTDHSEILVLSDELAPGTSILEALAIADDVLELEVTPNRPDCLSIYGVAREVHAITGAELAPDPGGFDTDNVASQAAAEAVAIKVADPDICRRFTARVFTEVQVGPSPAWLKARLTSAGQRPISNVVDVTNYVMLVTGQPLHAFDCDAVVDGELVVRRARAGETLTTLDGQTRALEESMAVIADGAGVSSLAGVMGGERSEVGPQTTRVLMESATWEGPNILDTSARLGLRSDASTRFEKQLHPEQALGAQRLAARLMVEVCGARQLEGTIDVYPNPQPTRSVRLRQSRIEAILGASIAEAQVRGILERLGFGIEDTDSGMSVAVPPFRDSDIQREADLIEEVARVYGLDKIRATLPSRRQAIGALGERRSLRRRLEDALRDRGLLEVVSYSFTRPAALYELGYTADELVWVANPLSSDQGVMRPLLLPGLLDALRHNISHGRPQVALFESARTFAPHSLEGVDFQHPGGALAAHERHHLGCVVSSAFGQTWRSPGRPADFYVAKALVEALLGGESIQWRPEPGRRAFLHPGKTADVVAAGQTIGWIGELHPTASAAWELDQTAAFELDADAIFELVPAAATFAPLASFPAVVEDIAVVVSEEVTAQAVIDSVRHAAGSLLRSVSIFDVYRGEQVGAHNKSLGLRLEFRADDRTLQDSDVAELRPAIEGALSELGGRLRA